MGQVGRDFQAYVAVAAFCLKINGPQDIRCVLNIADGEMLEDSLGVEILLLGKFLEFLSVVRAAGDGFFEDGGIGGHAAKAVLGNQAPEFAGGEQVAADIVKPDGLAETGESLERIFGLLFPLRGGGWIRGSCHSVPQKGENLF